MNYAQTFLMANMNAFPPEALPIIKEELDQLDEDAITRLLMTDIKSPTTALVCAIFLGELGIDRFYIGHKGIGIAKLALTVAAYLTLIILIGLFLLVGVYIWKLVDCFLIMKACKQANFERLMWQINQVKQDKTYATASEIKKDIVNVPTELNEVMEVTKEEISAE
ncbi:NINE protein [Streptococcus sp. zg-86]|uniref:NINE protein n=1 Tax=Streptococcus zhangguiae TaxID=2664091 RepID=A0A6I4RGC9_9STRE|nr:MULTISPECIES: TM2 domain-containing protein [unclassified Streptococcus]MTB64965.1 NINE protein [Streptococcus sp. zg-86]MTB91179.1 NINE protein [Streptococcus sp. zg-36]MWV56950.1 NINE protein [Streptococcus sp. zg-70]QTH47188.1 TM2 domain-containing protein [Streptococcus sp. zg-86]